jgi:hypothetical protein
MPGLAHILIWTRSQRLGHAELQGPAIRQRGVFDRCCPRQALPDEARAVVWQGQAWPAHQRNAAPRGLAPPPSARLGMRRTRKRSRRRNTQQERPFPGLELPLVRVERQAVDPESVGYESLRACGQVMNLLKVECRSAVRVIYIFEIRVEAFVLVTVSRTLRSPIKTNRSTLPWS